MVFKTKNLMLTHCYYLICSPYSNFVSCLTNTFCNCFQYFVFSCPKSSLIWKAPQLFFVFHEFDIYDVYRSVTLKKYPSVWVCWIFPPDSFGLLILVGYWVVVPLCQEACDPVCPICGEWGGFSLIFWLRWCVPGFSIVKLLFLFVINKWFVVLYFI